MSLRAAGLGLGDRVRAFSSTPGGLPHGTPGAGLAEPAAIPIEDLLDAALNVLPEAIYRAIFSVV